MHHLEGGDDGDFVLGRAGAIENDNIEFGHVKGTSIGAAYCNSKFIPSKGIVGGKR